MANKPKSILSIVKAMMPDLDAATNQSRRSFMKQAAAAPLVGAVKSPLSMLASPAAPTPDRAAMIGALNEFLQNQASTSPYVAKHVFDVLRKGGDDEQEAMAKYNQLYEDSLDDLATNGASVDDLRELYDLPLDGIESLEGLPKGHVIDAVSDLYGGELPEDVDATRWIADPEFRDQWDALKKQFPDLTEDMAHDVFRSVTGRDATWDEARQNLGYFKNDDLLTSNGDYSRGWGKADVERLMRLTPEDLRRAHEQTWQKATTSPYFSPEEFQQLTEPHLHGDEFELTPAESFKTDEMRRYTDQSGSPRRWLLSGEGDAADAPKRQILQAWADEESPYLNDLQKFAPYSRGAQRLLQPYTDQLVDHLSLDDLPMFGLRDYRKNRPNRAMPYSQANKLGLLSTDEDY